MNKLLHLFTQGLIITFLIVLGLFLLKRIKKILAFLLACWILLAIIAVLLLPLVALIWILVYWKK